ncbi:MAG: hypothetical protein QOG04_502 [Actinomycetota bacterium]|jgi:hypothetical protein|nr:hypothetical protein [Actinomycetota bacterium]
MQVATERLNFYRISAASGMLGGVLAVVFNLLHPRSNDIVQGGRGELELIAGSDIWRLDHVMLGLGTALIFIGIIGVALSMFGTSADTWARAWLIFTTVAASILLVTLALDGGPMKTLADQWANGGKDAGAFAAANALMEINSGLLGASIALLFGVAPLLLGMAVMSGGGYPKALGQVALVGGALGLLDALLLAFQGFTKLSVLILFPITSVLSTIVLTWAAWELWTKNQPIRTTTAARTDPPVTPGL